MCERRKGSQRSSEKYPERKRKEKNQSKTQAEVVKKYFLQSWQKEEAKGGELGRREERKKKESLLQRNQKKKGSLGSGGGGKLGKRKWNPNTKGKGRKTKKNGIKKIGENCLMRKRWTEGRRGY